MAEEPTSIDISDVPDLLHLAEEVRRAGQPRIPRRDGEDLALVIPLPQPKKIWRAGVKTGADYTASRWAAGGWKDHLDVDQFVQDIYDSWRNSTRPPVEL